MHTAQTVLRFWSPQLSLSPLHLCLSLIHDTSINFLLANANSQIAATRPARLHQLIRLLRLLQPGYQVSRFVVSQRQFELMALLYLAVSWPFALQTRVFVVNLSMVMMTVADQVALESLTIQLTVTNCH